MPAEIVDSYIPKNKLAATSGKKSEKLYVNDFAIETFITEAIKKVKEVSNFISTDIMSKEKEDAVERISKTQGIPTYAVMQVDEYYDYAIINNLLINLHYVFLNIAGRDMDKSGMFSEEYMKSRYLSVTQIDDTHYRDSKKEAMSLWNDIVVPLIEKEKELLGNKDDTLISQTNEKPTPNYPITSDENNKIPERYTYKFAYDINIEYLRPDGEFISIENFINAFSYFIDFDRLITPVFSADCMFSDTVMRDFKDHFDNLQFFISILVYHKTDMSPSDDMFIRKEHVFNRRRIVAIDPNLSTENILEKSGINNLPRHRIKLDFILYKDLQLNAAVQSKVFNNVRVLDVIHALFSEAYSRTHTSNDTKDLVRLIVTPPDNNRIYEQIILDPGNLSQNVKQLQEKYGIYTTGVRVLFDSTHMSSETTFYKALESTITITEKGGDVPMEGKLDKIILEVIDPGAKSTNTRMPFESGWFIDRDSNTMYLRTSLPYTIIANNSAKILNGESVRVVGASTSDHLFSVCDTNEEDPDSTQRTYWSNNDTPFALTQLQDNIKERSIQISAAVPDIDVLRFNNNLKYFIKFYNRDDEAYTGEYRLKSVAFAFDNNGAVGTKKENLSIVGHFQFANIGKIAIEGRNIERSSYNDKFKVASEQYSQYQGKSAPVPMATTNTRVSVFKGEKGGPFKVAFAGKEDYNGLKIPKEINDDYKMSNHIFFKDCYVTKDGTNVNNALGLCERFELFINAQKFSKNILDPIINMCGKFTGGNGKMNSFYRAGYIPPGGAANSKHLIALAADMALSVQGDPLADPFFKIAKSNLDFDKLILEGNGSQWRWIHVQWNANSANSRKVMYILNSLKGGYNMVNMKSFTSAGMAKWSEISKIKL